MNSSTSENARFQSSAATAPSAYRLIESGSLQLPEMKQAAGDSDAEISRDGTSRRATLTMLYAVVAPLLRSEESSPETVEVAPSVVLAVVN